MTEELSRLLRRAAAVEPLSPQELERALDGWWRSAQRQRRRQHLAMAAAVVALVLVATTAVFTSRAVTTVDSGGTTQGGVTTGSGPDATSDSRSLVNAPGTPRIAIEPASLRAGDPARLTVTDPSDVAYKRSALLDVQRLDGDEWVTVRLIITQPDDATTYAGLCQRSGQAQLVGTLPAFRPGPEHPAPDPNVLARSFEELRTPGRSCTTQDFTLDDTSPQLVELTSNLFEGRHRVCTNFAPVESLVPSIGRATTSCAEFDITLPSVPHLSKVDGPCPFTGDGTMPPAPTDPMAPRPSGVSAGTDGSATLWFSSANNGALASNAVAVFDLRCQIQGYMVPNVGLDVRPDQVDAILADLPIAQARHQIQVQSAPFKPADPDTLPTRPGVAPDAGVLLGTIRDPLRNTQSNLHESLEPLPYRNVFGHVPTSPKPGQPGNAVLSWTGSLNPGDQGNTIIPNLAVGDEVDITSPGRTLRYRVIAPGPTTTSSPLPMFADQGDERITLFQGVNGTVTLVAAVRLPD